MPKSQETEIAILQTQMTEVKTSVDTLAKNQDAHFLLLSNKIDSLSNTPRDIEILKDGFDQRLRILENAKAKAWVWNTLSAAAGVVLASLIIYAVTKK